MAKVLVGLSGGVDSAVAAALLVEQGHEVAAGYMKNWINDEGIPGDCPWEQDIEDARAVAKSLGIEFRVIDLIDSYRDRIVDYLIEGYRSGITPNPGRLVQPRDEVRRVSRLRAGPGIRARGDRALCAPPDTSRWLGRDPARRGS